MYKHTISSTQYMNIWNKCVSDNRIVPSADYIKDYLKNTFSATYDPYAGTIVFNSIKDYNWFLLCV